MGPPGSRLPSHLFDIYAFYKAGTREVILWLFQNTDRKPEDNHVYSIRELKELTNLAMQEKLKVPESILGTLRKTINARKRIGDYFRSHSGREHQQINDNHSYFTEVLLKIHNNLHSLLDVQNANPRHEECLKSSLESSNMFDQLDLEECYEDTAPTYEINQTVTNLEEAPQDDDDSNLETHDLISEFMSLNMYLLQLEKLSCVVQESSNAAATGSIPILVTAFTTSLCYRTAMHLKPYISEYEIANPEQLLQRYTYCMQCINCEHSKFGSKSCCFERHKDDLLANSKSLQQSWSALKDFKISWKAKMRGADASNQCPSRTKSEHLRWPHDDLKHLFAGGSIERVEDPVHDATDRVVFDKILERMGQFIISISNESCHRVYEDPLMGNLKFFLEEEIMKENGEIDASNFDSMGLSFGLLLLLESSKSYYSPKYPLLSSPPGLYDKGIPLTPPPSRGWELPEGTRRASVKDEIEHADTSLSSKATFLNHYLKPSPSPNCRIKLLKFTAAIQTSIDGVFKSPNAPCGCLYIGKRKVIYMLAHCLNIASQQLEVTNFDIFHQAPWVAGNTMLENLIRASECGLKSWHHAYLVGTLLHIYNALVLSGALQPDKLSLMTTLCSLFCDTVFLGHKLPQRNLWSCFQRWSGAKLQFPGKCHSMHSHKSSVSMSEKKWQLEKGVWDKSQGGDNRNRSFDPAKISILNAMMQQNSVTYDDLLVRLYTPTKAKTASKLDVQKARGIYESEVFISQHIIRVQDAVLEEFRDELPVAKINYFKLYEVCCEVLRRISNLDHTEKKEEHICSCVTQILIRGADKQLNDPGLLMGPEQSSLVRRSAEVFMEAFSGKTLLDFTWDL